MNLFSYARCIAAKLLRSSEMNDDMAVELQSHMQHRADDLERSGLPRVEAERRARIEFGSQMRFKEECREALGGTFVEALFQDARYCLRALRKSPAFAIVAVATLALAIGANSVVFGVLNGLILRPLNVPQAESLYGTEYGADVGFQSYPSYIDLRDRNRSFEDLAAFKFLFGVVDTGNDPMPANGFATTGNYFDVLKLQPYLGRFFHASDEHGPNSAPYVVLSHAYWHRRFDGDRSVVGRVIQINKHPFTIIGVAPPEFHGTILFISIDLFIPIVNQQQVDGEDWLTPRGTTKGIFESFGHLKPGVTAAQAAADLDRVASYLEKVYPQEFAKRQSSIVREGLAGFTRSAGAFVGALMLLAALILFAACANLGGLFAARAADRSREMALRLALGSSRSRILQALFAEAVLISLMGGVVGLMGSTALLKRLSVWEPFPSAPLHLPVAPDARVYIVSLALALLSGFLFGIVPVRQVLRTDPYQIVKAGSHARIGRRLTLRDALLVVQIALCGVLVTSSFVAVSGLLRSLTGRFGFDTRDTVLVGTNLASAGYVGEQVPAMQKRMIDALKTIPGVDHVGLVNNYPPLVYTAAFSADIFKEDATDLRPSQVAIRPFRYEVSPDYLAAAGTKLLTGRDFNWHDEKNAPAVALVNRDFAVKMFGGPAPALDRYFKLQDGTRVKVVGVIENGKYLSLTENQKPAIFLSFLQYPSAPSWMLVRSTRDPQQLIAAIHGKLGKMDSGLLVDTETWNSLLTVVLFPSRVATMSLGVLGIIGAMLSITGIFGMAAYSVTKRLKELGIRMALGAQRREVLTAALGRAFRLLAFGSAAGLVLGILSSRVLAAIVYQASPRDPLVLIAVVITMAILGVVATWLPAQRALSLDPMTLLREE
ncbi:MAG: ABC transporter permease [Acidobacteriaceae bacterium]|nr:ABC transporter permease [Acidobacteriaceae bacterium]